jgi:hypothetical protein
MPIDVYSAVGALVRAEAARSTASRGSHRTRGSHDVSARPPEQSAPTPAPAHATPQAEAASPRRPRLTRVLRRLAARFG